MRTAPRSAAPLKTPVPRWAFTDSTWGLLFTMPALLLVGVFGVMPILTVGWLGFHRRLPIFDIHEFVGLANY